jgi:hypothetical protein
MPKLNWDHRGELSILTAQLVTLSAASVSRWSSRLERAAVALSSFATSLRATGAVGASGISRLLCGLARRSKRDFSLLYERKGKAPNPKQFAPHAAQATNH